MGAFFATLHNPSPFFPKLAFGSLRKEALSLRER
jgi:hypothetical protein